MDEYCADLQEIYTKCLGWSETFPSQLTKELNIHPVHQQSVGVWPSTELVRKLPLQSRLDFPDATAGIVVPCYNSEQKITNLQIISYSRTGKIQFDTVGNKNLGWFNYLNSYRSVVINGKRDPSTRLTVFENIQGALSSAQGVFSRNINQINISMLSKISYKLAVRGSQDFLKRFAKIEGFDITLGDTDRSIWDVLQTDFIFSDLAGLDLRAIIPRARDYAKGLPSYEREAFNDQLKKILKVDLKVVSPLLFENFNDERQFIEKLRSKLRDSCSLVLNNAGGFTDSTLVKFHMRDKMWLIQLNPEQLVRCFHAEYGDVISWVHSVCPIPIKYWWDKDTETRHPRIHVYEIIKQTLYQLVLELLNEKRSFAP